MDIYQCMDCGERWTHGGLQQSMSEVAQHVDMLRHQVLVGEIDQLAEMRRQVLAGKSFRAPSQNPNPIPPRDGSENKAPSLPVGRLETFGDGVPG